MVWTNRPGYDGLNTVTQRTVIQHPSPTDYDYMGGMVSASHDSSVFITTITAVGCAGGTGPEPHVQVWRRSSGATYTLAQEISGGISLTPNDDAWAVKASISGDGKTLIIPVPRASTACDPGFSECGDILVYRDINGTFVHVSTISSDPVFFYGPSYPMSPSMRFGYATSINYLGNCILVGYPFWNRSGYNEIGQVTTHRSFSADRSVWSHFDNALSQFLPNLYSNAHIGYHVAISGDGTKAAIGFRYNNGSGGVKIISMGSGFSLDAVLDTLVCPNAEADDRFGVGHSGCGNWFSGRSIAFDYTGEYLVVGAPGINTAEGKAYIFKYNGLTGISASYDLIQTLEVVNGDYTYTGFHVSISPQHSFVAIGMQGYGSQGGAILAQFNHVTDQFDVIQTLTPIGASGNPYFGYAVEVTEHLLLVTATDEDERGGSGIAIGATYLYSLESAWRDREGY